MGSAIQASSSGRRDAAPDINVTPLVDVVLVLLIIFMVIAPALEHGESVDLPGVLFPDKSPKSKVDPVTVTLGRSGTIYVEKVAVPEAELPAKLAAVHEADPTRRVVLRGDSTLEYQKVRALFGTVQAAGFPGVSLMVSKKKGAGGAADDDGEE
ncbi:MAG: biopolymer transporter ExbD [Myxococcales bacterium]|jgi:biopolymer transport protein TolR|nr:biopolymer transporter ExbD [Myxococcales bacterium]MCB2095923.1 biopolymer transporter ExbD [Paracoccaceae bacterium]